jgi:hypothetical protein
VTGRPRVRDGAGEAGQALAAAAVAFPLLVLVMVALVQFALYYHAQGVVTAAVQDGARLAAAEDRSVADGVAHARALLTAGLGRAAPDVAVEGADRGDAVALEARGGLRAVLPWVADARLPLGARAVVSKERFRAPGVGS